MLDACARLCMNVCAIVQARVRTLAFDISPRRVRLAFSDAKNQLRSAQPSPPAPAPAPPPLPPAHAPPPAVESRKLGKLGKFVGDANSADHYHALGYAQRKKVGGRQTNRAHRTQWRILCVAPHDEDDVVLGYNSWVVLW